MKNDSFIMLVNDHLAHLNKNRDDLASAAIVSRKDMQTWLEQAERHRVQREHVNRIAVAIAFLYDQAGDSGAIDRIEYILGDLLVAAGCDPLWGVAA